MIEPQAQIYGLRNPKDEKTPKDYMRISYKEEDEAFLADQQRKTLNLKEMKKKPREVLQDGWDEDMKIYAQKRKPWASEGPFVLMTFYLIFLMINH